MTSENKLYNSWYRSTYPGHTDDTYNDYDKNNRAGGVSYIEPAATMIVNQRSSLCAPIEPISYCYDKSWDAHHFGAQDSFVQAQ